MSSSSVSALPPELSDGWLGHTWTICGELPGGTERSYNDRALLLTPASRQKPIDIVNGAGVACCVIKGDKYGDQNYIGQDNLSISKVRGGWEVYCVADGHGPTGDKVATYTTCSVAYHLSGTACQTMLENANPRGALVEAFRLTQQALAEQAEMESEQSEGQSTLKVSGATIACILKDPEHKSVWVAHLGDLRTMMFSPDSVLAHTQEHTVKVPSEVERIEACGCEVRTRLWSDGLETSRIYLKDQDFPGIMMTRSLGDLYVKDNGIIAEPEIDHWEGAGGSLSTTALSHECYILSASDGIWEFMDVQTVHAMVSSQLREGKSLQEVCTHLVNEAKSRWAAHEKDYCDDISVIILPLTGEALPDVEPLLAHEVPSIQQPRRAESTGCCAGVSCTVQ